MKTPLIALLVALGLGALGCATNRDVDKFDHHWRSPILDALDLNHDGTLDSNELANAADGLLTLDKNKDGRLDYDEIHWLKLPPAADEPEPVVQALDANRDDLIDAAEIANAPAALRRLDKNGDGRLTGEEYTPGPAVKSNPFPAGTGPVRPIQPSPYAPATPKF